MNKTTNYLQTTKPSDYDPSMGLCCTIGKYEYEALAGEMITWLQTNGDVWKSVPESALASPCACACLRVWRVLDFSMPEDWLASLQAIRVDVPGPPSLDAESGLLTFPNGRRFNVCFYNTTARP